MKTGAKASRFRQGIRFRFERLLVRGPLYRLIVLAILVVMLAVLGGLLVWVSPVDDFESVPEAVWWALLRLTDPGYLGEETEFWMRLVALLLTVAGLAVFVGGLVAVITQWLTDRMEQFSLGLTPIRRSDHVVILGWTDRNVELAESLLLAQTPLDVGTIAMLVDRITPERLDALENRLGKRAARNVILRSGDPRRAEHLERVAALDARAVIVPGTDGAEESAASQDSTVLQAIANLTTLGGENPDGRPLLTAEVVDESLVPVATEVYPGDALIVSTNTLVAQSLVLGVWSPGLCSLFADLIDAREGVTFGVAHYPEMVGQPLADAVARLPQAVVVGLLRNEEGRPSFHHHLDATIAEEDRLVTVSVVGRRLQLRDAPPIAAAALELDSPAPTVDRAALRVLIVGWSGRVPELLAGLARHDGGGTIVDVISATDIEARDKALGALGAPIPAQLRQHSGSLLDPDTYDRLELPRYDRIVVTAGDLQTGRESRSIAAYLVLEHALRRADATPHVIVELPSPDDKALFANRDVEIVDTTNFVADTLGGLVVHPELLPLFRRIIAREFGAIQTPRFDRLVGDASTIDPLQLELRLRPDGVGLLGVQRATGQVELAIDKGRPLLLAPGDRAILYFQSPGADDTGATRIRTD